MPVQLNFSLIPVGKGPGLTGRYFASREPE